MGHIHGSLNQNSNHKIARFYDFNSSERFKSLMKWKAIWNRNAIGILIVTRKIVKIMPLSNFMICLKGFWPSYKVRDPWFGSTLLEASFLSCVTENSNIKAAAASSQSICEIETWPLTAILLAPSEPAATHHCCLKLYSLHQPLFLLGFLVCSFGV